MDWFNSAAAVTLEVYKPTRQKIGVFIGSYPTMPKELSLGKLTAGTEIIFTHKSAWYDKTPGPFYSTDPSVYDLVKLDSNKWQLTFDDGLHMGLMDGQFEVYKKDTSNNPICGNNVLDASEQCDGYNGLENNKCSNWGYIGGVLKC